MKRTLSVVHGTNNASDHFPVYLIVVAPLQIIQLKKETELVIKYS